MADETAVAGETAVTGSPVSQEFSQDFDELRSLLRPSESVKVLDEFSRWLFATTAVVGTLGAAFGISGLNDLSGTGKRLFATAVLCLGVSLALAALARAPRKVFVNRYSLESMQDTLGRLVKFRQRVLTGAALLFAAALVLAGLAPLLSN